MKVILVKDQENLGTEGDVVEVATGYARNFLLRRKIAIPATPGNMKTLEQSVRAKARAEEKALKKAEELRASLDGQTIEISAKAGKEKLYGTITAKEIASALHEQKQVTIDKKRIVLAESIKTLGLHPVTIQVLAGIDAKITVDVVKEED